VSAKGRPEREQASKRDSAKVVSVSAKGHPEREQASKRDSAEVGPVRAAVGDALARHCRVAAASPSRSRRRDSVVLLDAAIAIAAAASVEVVAFHVEHGLSPNAGAVGAFLRRFLRGRAVPMHVERVSVARGARISVEAAARGARYAALASLAAAHGVTAVVLGIMPTTSGDDSAATAARRGPARPGRDACRSIRRPRPLVAAVPRFAARLHRSVRGSARSRTSTTSRTPTALSRNALRRDVVPALRAIARLPGRARARGIAAGRSRRAARRPRCNRRSQRIRRRRARPRNACRARRTPRAQPAPVVPAPARPAGASQARLAAMLRQLVHADADARVSLRHAGAAIGVHRDASWSTGSSASHSRAGGTAAESVALPHGTLTLVPALAAGSPRATCARLASRSKAAWPASDLRGRHAARRPVADLLREAASRTGSGAGCRGSTVAASSQPWRRSASTPNTRPRRARPGTSSGGGPD
jgi:hypothetical protein